VKYRRAIICTIAFAIVLVMLLGCGTTHHFLPGRPLESKEWMVSVNWHFDANCFNKPYALLYPELSAYVGLGKNYNFGFGGYAPFMLSHVSLAKYSEKENGNYWMGYGTVNKIYSQNSNPILEMGAAYCVDNGILRQNFLLGVGIGQSYPWQPMMPDTAKINWKLLPVLKYTAMGKEIGFGWTHYFGQTKMALELLKHDILYHNDTILVLNEAESDSIRFSACPPNYDRYFRECVFLSLPEEKHMIFKAGEHYVDAFYIPTDDMQEWIGHGYTIYKTDGKRDVIMNVDSLNQRWRSDGRLIITRYPAGLLNIIESKNSLLLDNAFAFSLFHMKRH
jgi:hypothetical protein